MAGNNGELITERLAGFLTSIFLSEKSNFLVFPNGMIIQKIVQNISNDKEIKITLPTTFPNRILLINNFNLCDPGFFVKNMSRESFTVNLSNFKGEQLQLIAIGY